MREPERYEAGPYIPPAPETPSVRPQRMPQIEDLPMPVQNQIRQQYATGDQSDIKRRTLLERLAAFGMSREDAPGAAIEHRPAPQLGYQPQQPAHHQRPAAPNSPADYAKRPAAPTATRPTQQSLDPHGRMAPAPRQSEDDQLEIPAFLRRQTS